MHRKLPWLLVWTTLVLLADVPTPREHLGFTPGDDYKLADTSQIFGYFQKLAAASDRIRFVEFGKSALGKPMYIAFISDAANLQKLDRWREISRGLALGQPAEAEARALAEEGKAIVWIDSGLHASEVAPAQHAPELAWRMITGEDAETRAIRQSCRGRRDWATVLWNRLPRARKYLNVHHFHPAHQRRCLPVRHHRLHGFLW